MVSLFFVTPHAQAGSWVVSYVYSGSSSSSADTSLYNGDYDYGPPSNSASWQDYIDGNIDNNYDPLDIQPDPDERWIPLTAKGSGTITATLTWTHSGSSDTSSPPSQIFVLENAEVQATNGRSNGPPSGAASASVSLKNAVTTTDQYGDMTSSAFQWDSIDNSAGKTVVPLTACSLSGSSSSAPASSGGSGAGLDIFYTATVEGDAVINPGGAIKDSSGNYSILVGQGCTASLSGIPSVLLNNKANPPTYQWSIKGTTFQGWVVSANQQTATLKSGPGPLNLATAHWYWNEAATTETISCSVTLTPPSGQGAAFTVTPSVQVAVADPSYSCMQFVGQPYITPDGTILKARGASTTYPRGDSWVCSVLTPALFGSGGSCNFCQLITPGRSHTYSSGTVPCSQNNIKGLDTVMPYPSLPSTMSDGDPYTVGSGITNGWPADNSSHHDGDSPHTLLVDNDLGTATGVSVSESFNTTLMYTPPGGDVQPVALHELDWKWAATVTEPAGGWATSDGLTVGSVTSTGSTRVYPQPIWSLIESPSVGSGW